MSALIAVLLLVVAPILPGPISQAIAPAARAAGPTLEDSDFEDEVIFSGFTYPTAVVFAADGHVFVAQKDGRIYVFDDMADSTATLFADLRSQVHDFWDRGLLGLAVHPNYPATPWVYALYTYDPSGRWGDACPNPPGATADGCLVSARLARLTAGGSGPTETVSDRTFLITDWCQQFPSHSIGSLVFGPGPSLFVSGGDGASFNNGADYGQWGGTRGGGANAVPLNPCNDPGIAGNPNTDPITGEGGGLRSQDIRTTGDPLGLDGAILRLDPATGAGWSGNPNAGSGDANMRRIVAYGLRNPFRITVRPGTSEVWIGDVGYTAQEEIDRLIDPTQSPRNFGWPCFEGNGAQSAYAALGNDLCTSLPQASTPAFTYAHSSEVDPGDGCGTGSSAIAGITFLAPNAPVPSTYQGNLFFTAYNRRCIWRVPDDGSGVPVFGSRELFANLRQDGTNGGSVFLTTDSVGHLVYVDFDRGEVHRIRHNTGNHAPDASLAADPTSGTAPLTVDFDATGSSDPEGDDLSYAWDFDGDQDFDDGGANDPTVSFTYPEKATVTARVRVTDSEGASDIASRVIVAGGTAPSITAVSPAATLTWTVGQTIAFSGTATDAQDGTLGPSAFRWTLVQKHCYSASDCHDHVVQSFTGVASGSFVAPDHEMPSHLELRLTVTDSDGQTASLARAIHPKSGTVTVSATRPEAILTIGTVSGPPPVGPVSGIVNGHVQVTAPASVAVGEALWAFSNWSDGGARVHAVTVAPGSKHLTATYAQTVMADAPASCGSAPVGATSATWRSGRFGSTNDTDWYRFRLTSSARVRIVLGNLAVGARLQLLKGCSTSLALVDRAGLATEEIVKSLAPGTYAIRLVGSGTPATAPYALRISSLSNKAHILSTRTIIAGGSVRFVGEVMNNTSSARGPVLVTAKLFNAANKLLATRSAHVVQAQIPAWGRAGFVISGALPAGYHHVVYALSAPKTKKSIGAPSIPTIQVSNPGGRWTVTGTARNPYTRTVTNLRVGVTLYDKLGNVLDVGRATVGRTRLAKGKSTTFRIVFSSGIGTPDRTYVRGMVFR